MSYFKKFIGCLSVCMLLTACTPQGKAPQTESQEPKGTVKATISDDLTQDYRVLVIDGQYKASQTRGLTLSLGTSENISAFETGLLTLSKKTFTPSQYYFLEGQFITRDEVIKWLGKKSDENPQGLNRSDEGTFVVTILEQDFMSVSNGDYELSGVSIGIAVDPTLDGKASLTDEQVVNKAYATIEQLLPTLRAKDGFSNLPIVFGIFKQSVDRGVSTGKYLGQATSKSGDSLEKWANTKVEYRTFPLDIDKAEEVSVFNSFKQSLETFFPSLSGVVGRATFVDDAMISLDVTITAQFYGQVEMLAFAQHIKEKATQTYPVAELKVTIKAETIRGTELVVYKAAGENSYHSVVLQ